MKRDLRIIFMGTPQFAVPSLESLIDNGFNVVGVITAPPTSLPDVKRDQVF